jgi:integrase
MPGIFVKEFCNRIVARANRIVTRATGKLFFLYLSPLFTKNYFMNTSTIHISRPGHASLTDFAEAVILELKGCNRAGSAKTCRSAVNSLTAFTGNEKLLLEDVSPTLICRYEGRLLDENKSRNTVSCYMRNLRTLLNKATGQGIIPPAIENPFARVHTGTYDTQKRSLTDDEMRRLASLSSMELLTEAQHHALLRFLFEFDACGMSYIDLVFLKKNCIRDGHILYFRKKTKQAVSVKITRLMQEIMEYFAPAVADSPYVFPIIKPDKGDGYRQYETALRQQNRQLKKLAALAGIDKNLSTHVSRHSWATIAKRENFPVAVISECLGHKDVKTTAIYLDSFDTRAKDRVSDRVSGRIATQDVLRNIRAAKKNGGNIGKTAGYRRHKRKKTPEKIMSGSVYEPDIRESKTTAKVGLFP